MKKLLSTIILSGSLLMVLSPVVYAYPVMYNTKTHKFHKLDCPWAKKCTVNCIKIEKKEAVKRGGIPCKVCGG